MWLEATLPSVEQEAGAKEPVVDPAHPFHCENFKWSDAIVLPDYIPSILSQ